MGKTAIVTGAASGIGYEISDQLIKLGCEVHGIDIQKIRHNSVIGHICDVSDPEDVMKTVGEILGGEALKYCIEMEGDPGGSGAEKKTALLPGKPQVDYLINSAGVIKKSYTADLWGTNAAWKKVMDVNLNGTFYMSKYFFPWIKPEGCILNFSSEQVNAPNINSSPYAVSKAAIEMLSKIMAIRGADKKIRVNTVALGTVRTPFIFNSGLVDSEEVLKEKTAKIEKTMPFGIIETEEVWKLVRYLLFDAGKLTGQTILMDSGLTL